MDMTKKLHGAEHPDTLYSMTNLASIYQSQRRWNEAEQLDVQVMDMTKKLLGEEHPDTLSSMASLHFHLVCNISKSHFLLATLGGI